MEAAEGQRPGQRRQRDRVRAAHPDAPGRDRPRRPVQRDDHRPLCRLHPANPGRSRPRNHQLQAGLHGPGRRPGHRRHDRQNPAEDRQMWDGSSPTSCGHRRWHRIRPARQDRSADHDRAQPPRSAPATGRLTWRPPAGQQGGRLLLLYPRFAGALRISPGVSPSCVPDSTVGGRGSRSRP